MSEYNEKKKQLELQYAKNSLKRIPLDVQKDYYQNILKPVTSYLRMPINRFIKLCINKYIAELISNGILSCELSDNFQKYSNYPIDKQENL